MVWAGPWPAAVEQMGKNPTTIQQEGVGCSWCHIMVKLGRGECAKLCSITDCTYAYQGLQAVDPRVGSGGCDFEIQPQPFIPSAITQGPLLKTHCMYTCL